MFHLLWVIGLAFGGDPRVGCEDLFNSRPAWRAQLFAAGELNDLSAERAALVAGHRRPIPFTLRARVCALFDHAKRADFAVLVNSSGEPRVYAAGETLRRIAPDPNFAVRVPAFDNALVAGRDEWCWRGPPPPPLRLGQVPKGAFLARYETPLRHLIRVGALRAEDICRGVVMQGVHYDHEVDVLVGEPAGAGGVFVFSRGTVETAREFGENALIILNDGRRLGWRDGYWSEMPPPGLAAGVAREAISPGVRELAGRHPAAVDQIGWQPEYSEKIDLLQARADPVRNERTGQGYVLVDATEACFLFDPAARDWADVRDMKDQTYVLPDLRRIGFNLGKTRGWRRLGPVDEFERMRDRYAGSP